MPNLYHIVPCFGGLQLEDGFALNRVAEGAADIFAIPQIRGLLITESPLPTIVSFGWINSVSFADIELAGHCSKTADLETLRWSPADSR